jgi:hypothetical protein
VADLLAAGPLGPGLPQLTPSRQAGRPGLAAVTQHATYPGRKSRWPAPIRGHDVANQMQPGRRRVELARLDQPAWACMKKPGELVGNNSSVGYCAGLARLPGVLLALPLTKILFPLRFAAISCSLANRDGFSRAPSGCKGGDLLWGESPGRASGHLRPLGRGGSAGSASLCSSSWSPAVPLGGEICPFRRKSPRPAWPRES